MAENNNPFRKKSLERISSPDVLDKYIKTTNPTIILLFIAVSLFLIGLFTWATFGRIESQSKIGFVYNTEDQTTISYIKESDYSNFISEKINNPEEGISYIQENMYMQYGDNKISIDRFSSVQTYTTDSNKFLCTACNLSENDMYRIVYSKPLEFTVNESQFSGRIVYALISPINLLFE